jgi:hypothetical protein
MVHTYCTDTKKNGTGRPKGGRRKNQKDKNGREKK